MNFARVRAKGLDLANGFIACLATDDVPLPGGVVVLPIGAI